MWAAAHKFEVGRATGQCCLGVLCVLCVCCWRVGSMQKKGKARQGKTNPPAHAKQSWQGGKKMGKGRQENEALTTPCAHGLGVFSPPSMICSPVRSTPGWSGKRNTWRGTCLILTEQRPTALFIRVLVAHLRRSGKHGMTSMRCM